MEIYLSALITVVVTAGLAAIGWMARGMLKTTTAQVTALTSRFDRFEDSVERRFVETDRKIEALDSKMDARFAETDRKMDERFTEVNRNQNVVIEMLARIDERSGTPSGSLFAGSPTRGTTVS